MNDGVKSVERAFEILERIGMAKNGIGVTELASELDMYKSTIHRVLTSLSSLGYVVKDGESGRYKLGYKLLEVSSRLLNNHDIRQVALPFLRELAEWTNEVVHLVVRDKGQVVYIEKVEGAETIRMHSQIGSRVPVHCTSVGKAILAHLPEEEVRGIIERYGLAKHTEHTIGDEAALFEHLQQVRQCGYALDLEENEIGITCVAAPVYNYKGEAIAAISVSGPTMRMPTERLESLSAQVREVGMRISTRLGFLEN